MNTNIVATLWGLALSTAPVFSAVIFSDDFTTGTNAALAGQAPQVRPGTETWRAQSVFTKNTAGDGVVNSSGSGSANLALPTFDLSKIYMVTARVTNNLASSDADWIGVGFTTQTTNTNAWNVAGTGTYWMLWRGNDNIRAFNGAGASNSPGSTTTNVAGESNTLDLRVVLDFTTGGAGTVSYLYKNPSASDWTTFTTSSITESLRNGINSVGFTTLDNNTSIHSFEYTVIPEPRAALLGGVGLLMLLRRRR
jgi:hypothetical protein